MQWLSQKIWGNKDSKNEEKDDKENRGDIALSDSEMEDGFDRKNVRLRRRNGRRGSAESIGDGGYVEDSKYASRAGKSRNETKDLQLLEELKRHRRLEDRIRHNDEFLERQQRELRRKVKVLEEKLKYEEEQNLLVDQKLREDELLEQELEVDISKYPKLGEVINGDYVTAIWLGIRTIVLLALVCWGISLLAIDYDVKPCTIDTVGSGKVYCVRTFAKDFTPTTTNPSSTEIFKRCLGVDDSRCNCDLLSEEPVSQREGCFLNFTIVDGVETDVTTGECQTFDSFFGECRDSETCPESAQTSIIVAIVVQLVAVILLLLISAVSLHGIVSYCAQHPDFFFRRKSLIQTMVLACTKGQRKLMQILAVMFIFTSVHLEYVVTYVGSECDSAETVSGDDWTLNEDSRNFALYSIGLVGGLTVFGTMIYLTSRVRGELHWPIAEGSQECCWPWKEIFCCVSLRSRSREEVEVRICFCVPGKILKLRAMT